MASSALKTFRRKMANPLHWRKANRVFLTYQRSDLCTVAGAKKLIDDLAGELGVPLSPDERIQAATWLVKQQIDPQSARDRMSIWKKVK